MPNIPFELLDWTQIIPPAEAEIWGRLTASDFHPDIVAELGQVWKEQSDAREQQSLNKLNLVVNAVLVFIPVKGLGPISTEEKGISTTAKLNRHHTITLATLERLPSKGASDPRVRGSRGCPNRKSIPVNTHREIHSSPPGDYYPGGRWSRREAELIDEAGGVDNVTPEQLVEIREKLINEFGL